MGRIVDIDNYDEEPIVGFSFIDEDNDSCSAKTMPGSRYVYLTYEDYGIHEVTLSAKDARRLAEILIKTADLIEKV